MRYSTRQTLSSVKGRVPDATLKRSSPFPTAALFPSTSTHSAPTSEFDPERRSCIYMPISPSLSFCPSPSLFRETLGVISHFCVFSRSFMLCMGATVARHWCASIRSCAFAPPLSRWISLLTMNFMHHPQWKQGNGRLSHHHHVVLGLEEVQRLVHAVTDQLGTQGLRIPFLFSSLALDVNSSRFVAPSKPPYSCIVPHSDRRAHMAQRGSLYCPQNLLYACDMVSPEVSMPLGQLW